MPEELEDEFGDIIRKARAGLGYTPDMVARATRLPVDDIISMETYKLKPTGKQVGVLASFLNLDEGRLRAIAENSWHPEARQLGLLGETVVERIRVPIGAYGSNCYVLGCVRAKEAAVIDPGGAVDKITEILSKYNLQIISILITHAHMDHTGGMNNLKRQFPKACIVVDHSERIHGPDVRHPEDGEEFNVGQLEIRALYTPGHTPGSMCYYVKPVPGEDYPGLCFVGDLLFAGSVGGTSGASDGYQKELESIRTKVFSLPDNTIILPGHGPVTTVGEEKENNPFFG